MLSIANRVFHMSTNKISNCLDRRNATENDKNNTDHSHKADLRLLRRQRRWNMHRRQRALCKSLKIFVHNICRQLWEGMFQHPEENFNFHVRFVHAIGVFKVPTYWQTLGSWTSTRWVSPSVHSIFISNDLGRPVLKHRSPRSNSNAYPLCESFTYLV